MKENVEMDEDELKCEIKDEPDESYLFPDCSLDDSFGDDKPYIG